MELDPQQAPATGLDMNELAAPQKTRLIAPVWHTVTIAALILANSFLGAAPKSSLTGGNARILLYSGTFLVELFLVLLIWFWVRRAGISMKELIGGRWKTPEDFLLDVGIAIGFLVVSSLVLVGARVALGTLDLHNVSKQVEDTKRMLGPLIPRSKLEAGLFVLLSVFAGLFEEIIFRGYFQRQFGAMARSPIIGIIGAAALFGLAHGYQGPRMMIAIGIFGVLFGILAHLRKSLRPGMMAHAIQDAYSGLALYFFFR